MSTLGLHTSVDTHTRNYIIICTYTHANTCICTHMICAFEDKEKSVQITNLIEALFPVPLGT